MSRIPNVSLEKLPKLAPSDLRLLWVNDGYDGPLEAVAEHAGAVCLVVLHSETGDAEQPYRWLVIRLSDEQRADEERLHALFVEHVGDHWCFHGAEIPHPPPSAAESARDPEKFFAPYRSRPPFDVRTNVIVGWTDAMPER